ncbi:MAG: 2OG-Fe(II) oxygenase [Actinomycetota bacterium]
MIEPFFFDSSELDALADKHASTYQSNDPFPHIVIDDFLPEWVVDRVLEEFPSPDTDVWRRYSNQRAEKLESQAAEHLGPFTRQLFGELNSAVFVSFLQKLTGIAEPLIPDPYFEGGGLHQIPRGGMLKVHADFNRSKFLDLDRRVNALIYLNKDWEEAYGGHLELWDTEMTGAEEKVLPIAGRLAVFSTTDFSFHGHPDPLSCPEDRSRRSIALYYFSPGRPPEEISGDHSTLFKARPGEKIVVDRKEQARTFARRLTPPIVHDGVRAAKRRLGS